MPSSCNILIIGAGTMGAAAALACTRAGLSVLALDRFNPPHTQGEHHGEVRMFRMSYYEHPSYVPMLRAALDGWRELERETGESILNLTGALYLGAADSELITGSLRAAREHSLPHESLIATDIRARFPLFQVPDHWLGLFERDAGYVHCERAVRAMLAAASRTGRFDLRTNEIVESWAADSKGVTVRTRNAEFHAAAAIITAGPWSGQILRGLNIPLTVTRQVQAWAHLDNPAAFRDLPCWAIDLAGRGLLYGFPALSGAREAKLARHGRGEPADPDSLDRSARANDVHDFLPFASQYTPALSSGPFRTSICLYTNSPDGHFVIDRHPQSSNVVFAAGFSGHGFKFAPAIGTMLHALATKPGEPHGAPFLSLSRLTG